MKVNIIKCTASVEILEIKPETEAEAFYLAALKNDKVRVEQDFQGRCVKASVVLKG